MAITGASLQPIYERLNSIEKYHPMNASTFSDWSVEAGDVVTMTRGTKNNQVPVHSAHIVWRGSPVVAFNSNGNEERDSIAKVSKRKYGRTSEDGLLHTELSHTASGLRIEFESGIDSAREDFQSELEFTSSALQIAFEAGISSARTDFASELSMTASA